MTPMELGRQGMDRRKDHLSGEALHHNRDGLETVNDDNIISIKSTLAAKAKIAAQQREFIDQSSKHFRTLSRAVRQLRDDGASTKEIVHTLRTIADELDGAKPA